MADLDITGRVRVDASQAEGEFRRLGGAAERMSRDIGASSGRAGRSIDSIGAGATQSTAQLTRAQSRIRDEISRTTTQIQQLGKTASQKFEIKIATQGLDPAQFAPYLRRLREVEAAQTAQAAGAVRAAQSTAASSAAMGRASGAASELGNAMRGLAAAYGIGQLVQLTDQYTKFTAQLRLASTSTADYAKSLASVRAISSQSQQDIGAVGVLYARVANSTRELGVSQKQVGEIVKSVALSLAVSGATAAESASAILQLSQSFASGTLRGEEFNAVNEAAPRLMKALAEGMGVPIGKLKEMASAGLITSEVLAQALPKALGELNEEAKQVTTISGAFTVFNNELMQFVGTSAQSSGAVKLITDSIVSLSENLNLLAAGGIGLAIAKVTSAVGGIGVASYQSAAAAIAAAEAAGVQRAALIATAQAEIASTAATSSRLSVTNAMLAVSRQEALASLASANATAAQATAQIAAARAAGAQSFALSILAQGEVALLAAQQARSVSMAELAVLGQQQARVSAQITAATVAQTAAQAGLTAANAAGGAAASLATRALGFLGGPIGIITTLLGLGATAWILWGNSAKKGEAAASGSVESSTGEIIANLDKQISKLRERNALARAGLPEIAKGASEASQRLGALQVQLDNLQSGKGPTGGAPLPEVARVALLQATLREYGTLAGKINEVSVQQSELDNFGKTAKAGEWLKKYATNAEKLKEELAQARKELGDAFSPEIEKRIRAQYETKDKGAKAAAAAIKKEASEYDKLIVSIKTKIAQNREELAGGGKLNEAQKLGAKLAAEIAQGTRTMTAARQADAKAQLAQLNASEQALEIYKAQQKLEGERTKEAANTAADIAKIRDKAQALEDEAAAYGLTAEALQALTIARLEDKKAMLGGFDKAAAQSEIDAINDQIAALTRLGESGSALAGKKLGASVDEVLRGAQAQAALYEDEARLAGLSALERAKIVAQRKVELDYAKKIADVNKSGADDATKALARLKLGEAQQLESAAAVQQVVRDDWQKTADSINQSLTDALLRGFESGKDFAKNLRDTLLNMFKTLVLRPTITALMSPVASAVSGIAGSAAGGLGNMLGIGSSIGSLTGLTSGITTAITAGFKGATLGAGLAGPTTAGATGLMGAGNMLASIPGWGWALAGVAALGAIFSKKQTLHMGAGAVYSADAGLQAGAGAYNKSTFGFGAAKEYDAAGQELASGIAKGLATTLDGLAVAFGKKAGYEVATAFADDSSKDGAWGALRISMAGADLANWQGQSKWGGKEFADGEKGQKEYLAAIANDTRQVLLDMDLPSWADTILNSLGTLANMDALSTAVQQIGAVQTAFVQMGNTLVGFAGMSDAAKAALLQAAGGIDALATSAASYYENFYSESERAANTTRDVAKALADVGLAMPKTREGFRALVESQIALGDTGADSVAALLRVNGAFASVTPALEGAATAAQATAAQLLESAGISAADIGKTFRDVLVGRADAAEAGNALADMVKGGIYNAIAGGFAQQLTDLMTQQLIAPVIQAAIAGASISEAVSQSAIDSMVAQAQAAADALGQIFASPELRAAIDSISMAISSALGAAGAGAKPYAPDVPAYASGGTSPVEQVENAWIEMLQSVVQQTQDAARELARLGMSSYESALAAIGDKAQEQLRGLQEAGYMRGDRERLESLRSVRDTGGIALQSLRSAGFADDSQTIVELVAQTALASSAFDTLSAALSALPPEVQAMVNAETALLQARNRQTADSTIAGLATEIERLGFTGLQTELAGITDRATQYIAALQDLGQGTAANIAAVENWATAMTGAAKAADAATTAAELARNTQTASSTLAGLATEIERLGFTDLQKELAGITDRAAGYVQSLQDIGQGTDANISAVTAWKDAMTGAALSAADAASALQAASDAQAAVAAQASLRASLISVEGKFTGGGFARQYKAQDAGSEIAGLLSGVGINKDAGALAKTLMGATATEIEAYFREIWGVLDTDAAKQKLLDVTGALLDLASAAAAAGDQQAGIRAGLERQLLELAGDTAALRLLDIAGMDGYNTALYDQVKAVTAAKAAEEQLAAYRQRVAQERYGLETSLLQLQGNTAQLRARELDLLDPSNRALQEQIYAMQDQAEAQQQVAQAMQASASAAQQLKAAWQSVTDSLVDEVRRIRGLVDADAGMGYAAAQAQFAITSAQARAGDQDAARLLPGLSQTLLTLAEASATTLSELQSVRDQTSGSLEGTAAQLARRFGLQLPTGAQGINPLAGLAPAGPQSFTAVPPPAFAVPSPAPQGNTAALEAALRDVSQRLDAAVAELSAIRGSTHGTHTLLRQVTEDGRAMITTPEETTV